MQPRDRTYQFIADPTHKENLSGRVAAACINCRRKKIKCSGDLNCVQCREKGLHCEGPPSRRRPKRDSRGGRAESSAAAQRRVEQPGPSTNIDADSPRSSRASRTSSLSGSSVNVEPARSQPFETPRQHPYNRQNLPHLALTTQSLEQSQRNPAFHPMTSQFAFNANPTRTTDGSEQRSATSSEWSYNPSTSGGGGSFSGPTQSMQPPQAIMAPNAEPDESSSIRSSEGWWSSAPAARTNRESVHQLIRAAEELEEQAQNLRWQASRRQSTDEATQPQRRPIAHQSPPDAAQMSQYDFNAPQPANSLDPSSWFPQDRPYQSGFTPGASDYPAWWNASSDMQTSPQATAQGGHPVGDEADQFPDTDRTGSLDFKDT